ncbi:hypothetical protein DFS34DRAFT_31834 [Phlyctochytrium arcticum]|nr:hypothetical protein DFS34DRAFT_31834 [Phlyctochytrium arcticum]
MGALSTMNKSRPLNLSDTNIANLGSDLEKKVRLDAASTEKAWDGVGKQPGLKIWRIEQFKVVAWPESHVGKFHTGDSYIVLNTYKHATSNAMLHDVHFWLGLETSQDEAGVAAYKTVELDDFLGTVPVQHREVQGAESNLFFTYFKMFELLQGGIESGFRHVETNAQTPTEPRLFHIYGLPTGRPALPKAKRVNTLLVKQVALSTEVMNSGDVFVLDLGKEILQWNGGEASGVEKSKAAEFVRKLADSRKGSKVTVFEEKDGDVANFYKALGSTPGTIASAEEGNKRKLADAPPATQAEKVLYRLSDESGAIQFTQVAKGTVKQTDLNTNDVFIYDCGPELFTWVGKGASKEERRKALQFAVEYINTHNRPANLPITRVVEGSENQTFFDAFDK